MGRRPDTWRKARAFWQTAAPRSHNGTFIFLGKSNSAGQLYLFQGFLAWSDLRSTRASAISLLVSPLPREVASMVPTCNVPPIS